MNSILQCLSNTHSLRDYCLHNAHRRDLNNNSRANTALMEGEGRSAESMGGGGPLLLTPASDFLNPAFCRLLEFAKLLQTVWTSSSSEAVSPSEFKTQIQRYAPRFVGYK